MKFCMVTTFFGGHSFGGDAAYVERLSQALCRRGHEVHVYYCVDAFNAVRGNHPLREYTPPPGLHLHPLESGYGILSPLATQATGLPLFKCERSPRGVRCGRHRRHPLSQYFAGRGTRGSGAGNQPPSRADHDRARALADLSDALALEVRTQGLRRPKLHPVQPGGRAASPGLALHRGDPPRPCGGWMRLIFPSRHALEEHRTRGIGREVPLVHLPYFLPDDWSHGNRGRGTRTASGPISPRPAGWWR